MKLFLAGTFIAEELTKKYKPLYVLESFYYIKPWQIQEMSNWKMFLLDSGAFTFLHAAERKRVDWDAYLSKYIAFIKANCALPGFVDSKNEEKTERNAGYLVVSQSGGGMLRQGTREGIRRTPANRGMRAHRIVKGLDISEDVCHGMCP